MRILVTGASGFIGRRFLELVDEDWKIKALWHSKIDFPDFAQSLNKNIEAIKIDLSNKSEIEDTSKKIGDTFDVILHLAANGDPVRSIQNPLSDLIETEQSALLTFTTFRAKRLILFSTGAVYEGADGQVSPATVCKPILPYAVTHFAVENYAWWAKSQGNFEEVTALRFFGAYGPHEPLRKIYTRLCNAFGIEKKKEFTLRGNGNNLIDAMYIDDAVNAILNVMEAKEADGTYDLSSGNAITLNELVERSAKVFGINSPSIRYEGIVAEEHFFRADPKPFENKFGFKPKIKLEEGLRRHAEWLKRER
ncbi:TPA: hypothetical protein DEF17_03565 [bacterium]|nr:hypothetical protein [bacterium]